MQTLLIDNSDFTRPATTSEYEYTATFPIVREQSIGTWACTGPQPTIVREGVDVLDYAYSLMFEGRTADGIAALIEGLAEIRTRFADVPDDWRYFAESVARKHPVADLVRQDPIAAQATKNKKMHATDVALLDVVYGIDDRSEASITGLTISEHTAKLAMVRTLRARRTMFAQRIDEVAAHGNDARILVIGSGLLREGRLSQAVRVGCFETLVIVDNDAANLKAVADEYGDKIKTVNASLRSILSRSVDLGDFDLVYAPTLFDNLPAAEARRLAEVMFSMLRAGGRMILVNAGDDMNDAGYREAFLGWDVTGRDEADLLALTSAIPSRLVGQVRLYRDEFGISNFVELFRR